MTVSTDSAHSSESLVNNNGRYSSINNDGNLSPISFVECIRIPNVLLYSVGFGFFKFINYAIFFWLPYYLSTSFEPKTSNLISIIYDLGMMPGGILVGLISDLYGGRRACVIATFTVTLVPLLLIFAEHASADTPLSTLPTPLILVMLGIMGCLIGGPINIITSAVAVDLAEHSSISGRSDLMAVTGIINGFGSIMASLGLCIVGPIQSNYGWKAMWNLLACCAVIGTMMLAPVIKRELIESNDDESETPILPMHRRRPGTGTISTSTTSNPSTNANPNYNYSAIRQSS